MLDHEGYKAVLLPQVVAENNFTLSAFLSALCEKAGMDPLAWQEEMFGLKFFTAIVFSELGKRKKTYEGI